jgi:predicted permease
MITARVRSWLRALTRRSRAESEMDAELRFHMESLEQDLMAQGLESAEAARRARIAFGSVEMRKEECRESLGLRLWDECRADLRYAARMFRHSPGFTAIAVLSLALGIGANTAIFTLAKDVLLKTMAVPGSGRLRLFSWAQGPKSDLGPAWGSFDGNGAGETIGTPFPYPLYVEMRDHDTVLENMVAFKDVDRVTGTVDEGSEPLDGILVSGNFYAGLGLGVIAGRAITPQDDAVGAPAVATISDAYWARRFGRAAGALGKTIRLNHVPVTIVGVNAPRFRGPKAGGAPEIFFPLSLQHRVIPRPEGSLLADRTFWWVLILGRLKPGMTDQTATTGLRAEFENAFRITLPAKKPIDIPRFFLAPGDRGLDLQSGDLRKPIFVLLTLAGLVLAIACANLANLLLARAAARRREMSVRIAMGASRSRVVRQVLTESMLLAFAGGAAGLLLGFWGRRIIPSLFEDSWHPPSLELQFDGRVFAFTIAATVATGLLFGLFPALRATQTDPNGGLKETGRMTASRSRALLGKSLVVFQVSLSLLLLIGTGLFVRTLCNLKTTPLGFNPERMLLFELDAPRTRYPAAERIALYQRLQRNLAALPGVQAVTLSSEPLLAGSMENGCYRPFGQRPRSQSEDNPYRNLVGAGFFHAFQIPVIQGRDFTDHDLQSAPKVAIVNQRLARLDFPHNNPVGQRIVSCNGDPVTVYRIVGVTADAKYEGVRGEVRPTIYIPYLQAPDVYSMTYEVKTAASNASVLAEIRGAVQAVDKEIPLLEVRTQNQQIEATFSQERVFAVLTSGFGALALILASIGIYGTMAYTVSRRTNEIGIRIALGAQGRVVLAMVLRESILLVCGGIAIGLGAALALTRLLGSMLFGLKPTDPLSFAAAAFLLFGIAFVAGLLPARRAAQVDPIQALRHE